MKKVKSNKLQLNELTTLEKKKITGGAGYGVSVQCWCEGKMPMWFAGCSCPNLSCIIMSDLPEECMDF